MGSLSGRASFWDGTLTKQMGCLINQHILNLYTWETIHQIWMDSHPNLLLTISVTPKRSYHRARLLGWIVSCLENWWMWILRVQLGLIQQNCGAENLCCPQFVGAFLVPDIPLPILGAHFSRFPPVSLLFWESYLQVFMLLPSEESWSEPSEPLADQKGS